MNLTINQSSNWSISLSKMFPPINQPINQTIHLPPPPPPQKKKKKKKIQNWNQPCHSHYRNSDALDNWFNVHEVLLGVVDGGSLVKIVRFDGHYTTFVNWFDQGRYLKSSWSDLFLQETNFFRYYVENILKDDLRFKQCI